MKKSLIFFIQILIISTFIVACGSNDSNDIEANDIGQDNITHDVTVYEDTENSDVENGDAENNVSENEVEDNTDFSDYLQLSEEEFKEQCIPVYYETFVKEENYIGNCVKYYAYISDNNHVSVDDLYDSKINDIKSNYNTNTSLMETCVQSSDYLDNYGPDASVYSERASKRESSKRI
ncbi:MAG: hypothetical protein IKR70_02325 [Lachnospiraceae bacterium]|nr:hypothetical protein [Lachnospiraceae bacterium]